jgi:D-ribose pyranase
MLRSGILNPHLNALLARVRHTNMLVIADRAFPSWPSVETIDLALVDDIPRVPDVLRAILAVWQCGHIYMASEYKESNTAETIRALTLLTGELPITWEPHTQFKLHVPAAIGLIRTGDTTPYANMILESA